MNEDDPEFMRQLSAQLDGTSKPDDEHEGVQVLGLHVAMPPWAWGQMLAEEKLGIRTEKVVILWLGLFSFVSLLYMLGVMWRPMAIAYIGLSVTCAAQTWRWHRRRAARFAAVMRFIEPPDFTCPDDKENE